MSGFLHVSQDNLAVQGGPVADPSLASRRPVSRDALILLRAQLPCPDVARGMDDVSITYRLAAQGPSHAHPVFCQAVTGVEFKKGTARC